MVFFICHNGFGIKEFPKGNVGKNTGFYYATSVGADSPKGNGQ
jgi:hypothetical protein